MPPLRASSGALHLVLAALLCLAGTRAAAPPGPGPGPGPRRARAAAAATTADRWLRLMAEYAREGATAAAAADDDGDAGWFPRPIPITLPIGGGGGGGRAASLPVLILPVPVPAPATDASSQCSANRAPSAAANDFHEESAPLKSRRPGVTSSGGGRRADDEWKLQSAGGGGGSGGLRPRPFFARPEEPVVPHLDYIVSSQQLVELFQAQVAPDPELPPALIPDYTAGEGGAFTGAAEELAPAAPRRTRHVRIRRYQLPGGGDAPPPAPFRSAAPPPPPFQSAATPFEPAAPPPPRLERSLMLRGELTVPRSGYTEPYTVWWDAPSGAARVDLHGGATSAYRLMLPNGRVQGVEMRVDRSGEAEVRRCAVAAARAPDPADRDLPAVPDLRHFSFAGYSEAEFGRVERWTRTVSGRSGEMGGVRGEALTFRHEMLVARAPDNYTTTPLKYTVAVDSSVLGADCDGYVHRYTELRDQQHDPAVLRLDLTESCEAVEATARRDRVEPLREFTLPHRDPRYDDDYQRFKSEHRRQYLDDTEEAVRKTVMMQHSRFVDSGNRQGATFGMEVNHLGDRLDAELDVLRGVREDAEGLPAERFPHSRDQLAAMHGHLPRTFDWRERGAVTHVRNQGSCSSCWAFAVTGAVEGALYVRTRRLVPLSEQCLVDCAHPFGGHGCGGTWPSAAYDYVQERGLPALADYTPYQGKVLTCLDKRVPPVTHISSHVNVTRHNVQALKVAIRRHAPTVVIIDSSAKSFVFYKKGVVFDDRCAKNKAEHAVLAVGWGEQRREPHFILKNSWSDAWGDGGYVRLAAASNTCGVLSRPSYPRLERADVDAVPDLPPSLS